MTVDELSAGYDVEIVVGKHATCTEVLKVTGLASLMIAKSYCEKYDDELFHCGCFCCCRCCVCFYHNVFFSNFNFSQPNQPAYLRNLSHSHGDAIRGAYNGHILCALILLNNLVIRFIFKCLYFRTD